MSRDTVTISPQKKQADQHPRKGSDLTCKMVESVAELDTREWNALIGDSSIYLHSDYLKALEVSLGRLMRYRFAHWYRGKELVGVAAFQITHFESGNISSNFSTKNVIVSWFTKRLRGENTFMRFRVVVCGNAFATGEHGFRFAEGITEDEQYRAINSALAIIKAEMKAEKTKISAVIIKDFYPRSFEFSGRFRQKGYSEFAVDPNMVMPLHPDWKSLDDYLAALNSKFRTKAKSAYKKSSHLEVRKMKGKEFAEYRSEFQKLYNQVYKRADFRLGKLNFEAFANFCGMCGDRYFLKAFFLNGKLVGFQSGFEYNGTLDAHFVGIDYSQNVQHSIYPRMLYEYIDEAIERGCKSISFGRTAMEIKSSVGAFPVDLKLYIRHRSSAPNTFLRILFSYVKPSQYELRKPYKKEFADQLSGPFEY